MLLSHDPRGDGGFALEGIGNGDQRDEPITDSLQTEPSIPLHPLEIKPLGNRYLAYGPNARESLGTLQAAPDEVLVILLEYLDQRTVRRLGYTCKFLFALCASDDIWKGLFLEAQSTNRSRFVWQGTWRSTLLGLSKEKQIKVDCQNVFSDVLHRPYVCSNISLAQYSSNIPRSNQISRFRDLTYDEFSRQWSNKPFILTECVRDWPVCQNWDLDNFLKIYPDVEFRAEAVDWPFSTYHQYIFDNHDESPLYLFDRKFAEKMNLTVGKEDGAAYWKPDCFGPDLFELLGTERPAHRWLIIGPDRSGSTFHKDPNGTSAWNAVIQGAKYWIMFPPFVSVPGVYVSKDNSEVTSPLSIAEWLLEFHAEARELPECLEGVCYAGEILHVPSGWWHLVVNLESGIALTQNFVPVSHLSEVLSFLRDRPEQVTGFKKDINDPYALFVERLRAQHLDLLDAALEELELKQGRRKRRWEMAVGSGGEEEETKSQKKGFEFSFGLEDDLESDEGEVS